MSPLNREIYTIIVEIKLLYFITFCRRKKFPVWYSLFQNPCDILGARQPNRISLELKIRSTGAFFFGESASGHLSVVLSIVPCALFEPVARTQRMVRGCTHVYSGGLLHGAPTAKPQTRGLARPNPKPKPTLWLRG